MSIITEQIYWDRRDGGESDERYLARVLDSLRLYDLARAVERGEYTLDGVLARWALNDALRVHARRMQLSGQRDRLRRTGVLLDALRAGEFGGGN